MAIMIPIGKWRWPLVVVTPLMVGGLLFCGGIGRLVYEGRTFLTYSGDAKDIDRELTIFRSERVRQRIDLTLLHPADSLVFEKVPAQPQQISIKAQADWPRAVVPLLATASKVAIEQSLAKQKEDWHKTSDELQKAKLEWDTRLDLVRLERTTLVEKPRQRSMSSKLAAQIKALYARRDLLAERFPMHTDIALLDKQIKDLQAASLVPHVYRVSARQLDLDRRVNETKLRVDYFARRVQELSELEKTAQPLWMADHAMARPARPIRMRGWPGFVGGVVGTFLLVFILLKMASGNGLAAAQNGLWRPETAAVPQAESVPSTTASIEVAANAPMEKMPVELEVVAPEPSLPSDPLTEKAAMIYAKWVEVAKVLYAPAPEPPQGILDSVGPLLQESGEFLPQGHDVMARYLAHTVVPGDLPAHVARTVLMTLTGAEEAKAMPEHRLAMALAALFHDLAVVPRPAAMQEEAGSEIGRLSATVLRRIPGLQPEILAMVEEILIGMDEFKLDTWQNVTTGKNLEPLSKVLREIDRFEKVMQKQRARLDRQIANREAI